MGAVAAPVAGVRRMIIALRPPWVLGEDAVQTDVGDDGVARGGALDAGLAQQFQTLADKRVGRLGVELVAINSVEVIETVPEEKAAGLLPLRLLPKKAASAAGVVVSRQMKALLTKSPLGRGCWDENWLPATQHLQVAARTLQGEPLGGAVVGRGHGDEDVGDKGEVAAKAVDEHAGVDEVGGVGKAHAGDRERAGVVELDRLRDGGTLSLDVEAGDESAAALLDDVVVERLGARTGEQRNLSGAVRPAARSGPPSTVRPLAPLLKPWPAMRVTSVCSTPSTRRLWRARSLMLELLGTGWLAKMRPPGRSGSSMSRPSTDGIEAVAADVEIP